MAVAPNKGKITTTKPIPPDIVAKIKDHLSDKPREPCFFVMAINSALRGGDLLAIKRADLEPRSDSKLDLLMRELKTGKLRRLVLNEAVAASLNHGLRSTRCARSISSRAREVE